jgi:hypothetical protein
MLRKLVNTDEKNGLKTNYNKTKYLTVTRGDGNELNVNGNVIKTCDEYKYSTVASYV